MKKQVKKTVVKTQIQPANEVIFAPCSKPQEAFLNSTAYFTLYGGGIAPPSKDLSNSVKP
jgi:hypothetical protein